MTVTWPAVANWLVTVPPTFWGSDITVFDGPPVTGDDPADYLTVGYVTDDNSGAWQQSDDLGGTYHEIGTVRCELTCQTGDDTATSLAEVRSRSFTYVTTLDAALRADQTLGGVLSANGTVKLDSGVLSVQNAQGTALSQVLTVSYTTDSWS